MAERPKQLAHLEYLGDATQYANQIHVLIPRCRLLENFSASEVRTLAHFMDVYRASAGTEVIQEGDGGDFMLLVLEGRVDVLKRDAQNRQQVIAVADGGRTLGEMSMLDGEPRFATCVATEATTLAVLDRDRLARIIVEQPLLGSKILMELVLMLSQRLRTTSTRLLNLIAERGPAAEA